jgi:hypothetical protein
LAHDYAQAAAMLVDAALASREPWRVCYPIFYLYRHALELCTERSTSSGRSSTPPTGGMRRRLAGSSPRRCPL